jgi:hypothetical protein
MNMNVKREPERVSEHVQVHVHLHVHVHVHLLVYVHEHEHKHDHENVRSTSPGIFLVITGILLVLLKVFPSVSRFFSCPFWTSYSFGLS